MKKITRFGISALLAVLCLTGCLKDDTQSPCGAAQTGGIRLTLAIGDMRDEEIGTRSAVSTKECTITKLSVLLFDKSTGKFKESEEIDIRTQLSGSNGDKLRTLAVNLTPEEGDKLVVVANYEQNGTLTEGSSTTADINSVYKSSFNSEFIPFEEGLPMSGETTYSDSGVTCRLYHSVAKVQVRLADGLTLDGQAVTTDNSSWGIGNYLSLTSALVYGQHEGTIALNPGITESDFGSRRPLNTIDDASSQDESIMNRGYLPEYPNAKYAMQQEVDTTEFDAGRTCVFLRLQGFDLKSRDNYYRLDFSHQLRSTGLDQGASNEFLDIRRNTHYVFLITKIKSRGYRTEEEALANPGSNIEYTVSIENDGWESISSNGQYVVKTDRDSCFLMQNVAEPADLLKFAVQMPDAGQKPGDDLPGSIKTCQVSLVGEDKNTLVPSEQLQLCTTDGTSYSAIDFTSKAIPIPDEGYQLKYKSGATLPSEQCYVKIEYGNIRHYVPIGFVTFSVTADKTETDYRGSTLPVKVESYVSFGANKTELNWSRKYDETSSAESWFSFPENGMSGTFNAVVEAQTAVIVDPHNDVLKSAVPVRGTFDLSTGGGTGTMNTANCYVVNAPGTYSLPLVYGNAVKGGAPNPSSYTSTQTGDEILQVFVNHLNAPITDPYIYNNAGCTPANASLVWQDAENLVTNVALSSDKHSLTFEVPKNSIRQGNAIVAVRDASNTILWSWHIWVTDFVPGLPPTVEMSYDPAKEHRDKVVTNWKGVQYTFMGTNIGWCDGDVTTFVGRNVTMTFTQSRTGLSQKITVSQAPHTIARPGNNPYFQHGRKDPFLPADMTVNGIGDKQYYVGHSDYSHQFTKSCAPSIGVSIQNPFVQYSSEIGEWYNKPFYLNLWSANTTKNYPNDDTVVKTIYDPSPIGYCLPANAFSGFGYGGGGAIVDANTPYTEAEASANYGIEFYCNKMPAEKQYDPSGGTIFLPYSGIRLDKISSFSERGAYITAPVSQKYTVASSCVHSFRFPAFRFDVSYSDDELRFWGYSVRPVREKN